MQVQAVFCVIWELRVGISAVHADAFKPDVCLVGDRLRTRGSASFFTAIGYDFYRATIQMNEQAAMNIASLASQTIQRDIELYDLSLQSVLEGVNDPDILSIRSQPCGRKSCLTGRRQHRDWAP